MLFSDPYQQDPTYQAAYFLLHPRFRGASERAKEVAARRLYEGMEEKYRSRLPFAMCYVNVGWGAKVLRHLSADSKEVRLRATPDINWSAFVYESIGMELLENKEYTRHIPGLSELHEEIVWRLNDRYEALLEADLAKNE